LCARGAMRLAEGGALPEALEPHVKDAFTAKIEAWLRGQDELASDPAVTSQYVMVMVDNLKSREMIAQEMDMFLGAKASLFASWCAHA
jgi:hypothetical protein